MIKMIKVDQETHKILKAEAAKRGLTLKALLAFIAEEMK